MRVASAVVALLVLSCARADAAPVVNINFENSNLWFGFGFSYQSGFDVNSVFVDGDRVAEYFPGDYFAEYGPLTRATFLRDSGGVVRHTEYLYTGGTFRMNLQVWDFANDILLGSGEFVAPIVSVLVRANELPRDSADAFYLLGPGVFDASVAEALGIGRHIKRGSIFSWQGGYPGEFGDYTWHRRHAYNEVTQITLQVPEPLTPLLIGLGAVTVVSFRKGRERSVWDTRRHTNGQRSRDVRDVAGQETALNLKHRRPLNAGRR